MDMSLSLHAAPRVQRAGRRFPPAAAFTALAVLAAMAALGAQRVWDGARAGPAAAPSCAELLQSVSEMRLIDLARDPGQGGLTCSLRRSSSD